MTTTKPTGKAGGVLKLHKHRILQPWQAYYALTYESKWKSQVDQEWKEITTEWVRNNPGQPLSKSRFEFGNAFIKEKYEAESTEMKEQVEEFHQNSLVKSSSEAVGAFQEYVLMIKKT